MSLGTFTLVHVLISLVGILAGLIALAGWLKSDLARTPTAIFLVTTILTSATGFLFPFTKLLPSHVVGIVSLVALALATYALYVGHVSGLWRPIFIVTAILSIYLNLFVLLVQGFLKVPLLKSWAPTQAEPAFLVAQGALFVVFAAVGTLGVVKFRPARMQV